MTKILLSSDLVQAFTMNENLNHSSNCSNGTEEKITVTANDIMIIETSAEHSNNDKRNECEPLD